MKRQREILKSMNSFNDSWEEKAFAKDAAGSLSGCVWPPRSYSCSFCRREFKSAQALGGHMNVHRRDRARLKQSLSRHNNEVHHHQNHNQNSPKSSEPKCPSEICTSDCNLDHNTSPKNAVASALSNSRFSALCTQENLSENTFVSPYSYSSCFAQENQKVSSWSGSAEKIFLSISDTKLDHQQEKSPREEGSNICICIGDGQEYVETDLSVGLNSVICRDRPTGSCSDEAISCKRKKTSTAISTLPFFLSNDKYRLQKENLDLELRLGDPPK